MKRPVPKRATNAGPKKTDWQPVADWYDAHVGDDGGEYHREVVLPGVVRMLGDVKGRRVLDVACGQGVLCRKLADVGATCVGVDASADLIAAARERGGGPPPIAFHISDVRTFDAGESVFDAAACVLAASNIQPIRPVFEKAARALVPGGRFVVVVNHPAFRGAKESHWGWDAEGEVQYRRVDRYLLPRKSPIVAHPGSGEGGYTWTFHRPIGAYVKTLVQAGLLVDALEEWPSHKTSGPGPRQKAENRAREEIPMFLALRGTRP